MKKHKVKYIISALLVGVSINACASEVNSQTWRFDSLSPVAGVHTAREGDVNVVGIGQQQALSFDGEGDRLVIDRNPLWGATEFTVEIIFKANDVYPNNVEPRFFHIEALDDPARRLTIELRLNDKHQWYLDSYIKAEDSQLVLIDETLVHPVAEWAHAAVTYREGEMVAYVNGKKELAGAVNYLPISEQAKTSIGARMNQVHWFNGEIHTLKVTHQVLKPEQFLNVDQLNQK